MFRKKCNDRLRDESLNISDFVLAFLESKLPASLSIVFKNSRLCGLQKDVISVTSCQKHLNECTFSRNTVLEAVWSLWEDIVLNELPEPCWRWWTAKLQHARPGSRVSLPPTTMSLSLVTDSLTAFCPQSLRAATPLRTQRSTNSYSGLKELPSITMFTCNASLAAIAGIL